MKAVITHYEYTEYPYSDIETRLVVCTEELCLEGGMDVPHHVEIEQEEFDYLDKEGN